MQLTTAGYPGRLRRNRKSLTADYADNTDKSEDIIESLHGGSFVMSSRVETSLNISVPSIIGFPIV